MEILAKLFDGAARVKLMRLFLFNPDASFSVKDVALRTKLSTVEAKKELNALMTTGLIRNREIVREEIRPIRGEGNKKSARPKTAESPRKIKASVFSLNSRFAYLAALKNLLITASLRADESLVRKFAKAGKLKLLLASGVFLHEWDTRVDLLIVGDELNMANLEKAVSLIEAEIGKELSYSAFETEDFEYRVGIHDRLIRDILDAPHTMLIDRLGLDTK